MRLSIWLLFAFLAGSGICHADTSGSQDSQSIDLFEAIDNKIVSVKFIPVGAHRANVVFENQTNDDVNLSLPNAFGARHVLAQFGNNGGGGFGQGAGMGLGIQGLGGGGGQNLGGGFGQGNLGGFNNGGGGFGQGNLGGGVPGIGGGGFGAGNGRFFRVAPDKKRRITVNTFCLQYGKTDPNPRMKYEIVPLKSVCENDQVELLCESMASGKISQNVAQAVAWHLENGLSWEKLASLNRRESRYLGYQRFFSRRQLVEAKKYIVNSTPSKQEKSYLASTTPERPDGSSY